MLKKLLAITTALYLTMAAPAHAMPTLIGGIGALLSTQIAAGVTLGSIALGIASMGAQWLLSKILAPDQKQRGIKSRMETGGDNPPTFIVGEYATPGQLVYANERDGGTNIPNSLLVYVVQLSCMPVDSISNEVFVSNERCTIDTSETFSGGFYAVSEYVKGTSDGGYLSMKFHLGDQTAVDPWLMDKFGNDPDRPWSNDMFLPGCAYAVIRIWASNRGIWTGIPTFRWVVRGAKLYDPRKDSTVGGSGSQRWNNPNTWTFSKNAKVIEYNTHRGFWYDGKHVWGGKAEAYRLPLEYWFAAMNVCDENIERRDGEIIKRYCVGAEISVDDVPIEFINEVNKSCDGFTTEWGGTYKTWCGGPGLAVGTITDGDWLISEDMETNRFQGREQTFNTCYPTYPEPKQQWEVKEAPRFQDEDALDEDGEELPLDLPLPLVSENNQAQRLAKSAVKDSRRQVTHNGVLPPLAYIYEPFDLLMFQSTEFGYGGSGKKFIVASKEDQPNVNQQVLLREINPDDQGYVPADEQEYSVAPLVIIQPGELVLDLDVFPDQVDTASGKDRPAIRAEWSWGGVDIDVQYVDWRLRRVGTTKVIANGRIIKIDDNEAVFTHAVLRFGGAYEVQFRPKPFAIREAAWTGWKSVTCVVVDVPAAPSLTRISKLGSDGRLSYFVDVAWTLVSQEGSYAVRVVVDGQTTIYPALTSPLRIPVAAGSSLVVDVAAVGSDGTVGDWSATTGPFVITKKNTAPTAPTSLTAVGKIGRVVLKTTKNPDSDFDHWNLFASSTNDFTTATIIDEPRGKEFAEGDLGNAVTRYYWLTAVDSSGNESSKFPVSNTAGRVATTLRVTDADTDPTAPSIPAAPSLTQTAKDVDEDGKVDIAIKVAWLAATGAKSYEIEITQGSDVWYVVTKNLAHIFKAKSNKLYSVKVAAISFNGTASAFSSATTLTPTKKSVLPATPGGLVAASKASANRLDWTGSTEADFKWAFIYRNTTNTAGTATRVGKTKADWYRDDAALVFGTTYYYWVSFVDTTDNEGAKSAVASVAYAGVTTADLTPGSVTDAITDQTAPGTPAAPTLASYTADIDGDGSVDTGLTLSVAAPAGVKVVGYEIERHASSTLGGTYTARGERFAIPAEDPKTAGTVTSFSFRANQSKFWKTRARAIAFNGKTGPWSALTTTGVQPSAYSASLNASAPAVAQVANGYRYSWTKPTDKAYKETEILVNGVALTRVTGTAFTDTTVRTVGDTPTITVRHFDRSDAVGTTSSGTVAPAYRAANSTEVGVLGAGNYGAGSITPTATDGTVRAAPTGVSLSQANRDLDLDGTVDIALLASFSAGVSGAVNYEFELSRSSTSGGTYTVIETKPSPSGKVWFPANTQWFYKLRVRSINWDGTPGTWSTLVGPVQPAGVTGAPANPASAGVISMAGGFNVFWNAPSELDYDFSEIAFLDAAGTPTADDLVTTTQTVSTRIFYPYHNSWTFIYVRHVNTSGLKSGWVLASGDSRQPLPLVEILGDSFGTSGGSIIIPSSVGNVHLTASWRCTSTTTGITVTIGGISIGPVNFVDGALMSYTVMVPDGGGTQSVSKTGGGSWNNVRLTAVAAYESD